MSSQLPFPQVAHLFIRHDQVAPPHVSTCCRISQRAQVSTSPQDAAVPLCPHRTPLGFGPFLRHSLSPVPFQVYQLRQPCKFDQAGQPVRSQTLQFENGTPLSENTVPEFLYGYYPDGSQSCMGVVDVPNGPYWDGTPLSVTDCPASDADNALFFGWRFSFDRFAPEEAQWFTQEKGGFGRLEFPVHKWGRMKHAILSLDLRLANCTGHGELFTPLVCRLAARRSSTRSIKVWP